MAYISGHENEMKKREEFRRKLLNGGTLQTKSSIPQRGIFAGAPSKLYLDPKQNGTKETWELY